MPIDTSFYRSNVPLPDLSEGLERGFRMGQQMNQMRDQKAMKDAYAANTVTGEDGKTSFNRAGFLSALGKINPEAAMKQEQEYRQNDMQSLQQKRQQLEAISGLVGSAQDQNTWTMARQKAQDMGLDVSQVPEQYDPSVQKHIQGAALTGLQQLQLQMQEQAAKSDQTWKQKNYDLEKEKLKRTPGGNSAPSGYRYKPDGSLEPIPGGPAAQTVASAGVPGATVQPGAKPTADDAKKVKAALVQRNNLLQSIDKLDSMVKTNGTEAFSYGNASTDMAAMATDIRMGAKELYELGALSGPDMDLISKTIPDPTDWKWAFTMNSADKVRSALAQAKKIMEDKASNIAEGRGYSAQPYTPKDQDQNVAGAPLKVFKTDEIEWMP